MTFWIAVTTLGMLGLLLCCCACPAACYDCCSTHKPTAGGSSWQVVISGVTDGACDCSCLNGTFTLAMSGSQDCRAEYDDTSCEASDGCDTTLNLKLCFEAKGADSGCDFIEGEFGLTQEPTGCCYTLLSTYTGGNYSGLFKHNMPVPEDCGEWASQAYSFLMNSVFPFTNPCGSNSGTTVQVTPL